MQLELLLSMRHADSALRSLNIFKGDFIQDSLDVLQAELLFLLKIRVLAGIIDNYWVSSLMMGHQVF